MAQPWVYIVVILVPIIAFFALGQPVYACYINLRNKRLPRQQRPEPWRPFAALHLVREPRHELDIYREQAAMVTWGEFLCMRTHQPIDEESQSSGRPWFGEEWRAYNRLRRRRGQVSEHTGLPFVRGQEEHEMSYPVPDIPRHTPHRIDPPRGTPPGSQVSTLISDGLSC